MLPSRVRHKGNNVSRFAMLCVPAQGRLLPMLALGQALIQRGHQLTLLGRERMEPAVRATGIDFINLDAARSKHPHLSRHRSSALRRFLPSRLPRLGSSPYADATGLRALAISIESYRRWAAFDLERAPGLLEEIQPDALIASESSLAARTLAEGQGLPFITVSTGLPRHETNTLPPEFTSWPYRDALWARKRNQAIDRFRRLLDLPTLDLLNAVRVPLSLPPHQNLSQTRSPLATLSQLPPGFDFPVPPGESPTHYVGPLVRPGSREASAFPWEKLNGDPILYASAGTLSSGREFFQAIARACEGMPVQLIMSRGGGRFPSAESVFPHNTLIVDYAPQLEILERASLTITHGSANTMVESLLHGVPLVAIPLVFDQPGTAARLARTGAGISMSLKKAGTPRLRAAIQTILEKPEHRKAAEELQKACLDAGGVEQAADIIERTTLQGQS